MTPIHTTWRVFIYMDATGNMADMAIKNISDILKSHKDESIEIRIQLHAYDNTAYRYHVCDNALIYDSEIQLIKNSKSDFITAATWGFADCDSDHTMLILWNHGHGILDPEWDPESKEWSYDVDKHDVNLCSIKRTLLENKKCSLSEHVAARHRGFVFNYESHTYLNNEDLIESLTYIKEEITNGKLDILAFDTCMGAMLEVAYQVAPYADYLVGNQSCSLRDGFHYEGIFQKCGANTSPQYMAIKMIEAFDEYYRMNDQEGIYTHSAIDLLQINTFIKKLDEFLLQLLEIDDHEYLIREAALGSPAFCAFPMYPDLIAFLQMVEEQLNSRPSLAQENVKNMLSELYAAMDSCVVARCGGNRTKGKAFGLGIYLPTFSPYFHIDNSYYKTIFARETQWIKILHALDKYRQ